MKQVRARKAPFRLPPCPSGNWTGGPDLWIAQLYRDERVVVLWEFNIKTGDQRVLVI